MDGRILTDASTYALRPSLRGKRPGKLGSRRLRRRSSVTDTGQVRVAGNGPGFDGGRSQLPGRLPMHRRMLRGSSSERHVIHGHISGGPGNDVIVGCKGTTVGNDDSNLQNIGKPRKKEATRADEMDGTAKGNTAHRGGQLSRDGLGLSLASLDAPGRRTVDLGRTRDPVMSAASPLSKLTGDM
ncbi:hypothetical protein CPLU01_02389 [Colletotrichum plurivorum]|uniref:Uncharacterized protein n=1 Tax=Colletotrichum plurivorum TaxID=2175906 RepID=A0A8H6KWH9_9PEZI|nr:hypothetical protein CPLU01_02389 [Colletotrichum plurivorum]